MSDSSTNYDTHYDILEVSRSASQEEIKTAWLRLVREYHPDRVPDHLKELRRDAEEKTKQLNEAHDILSNPAKRREYDTKLDEFEKQNNRQQSQYNPSSSGQQRQHSSSSSSSQSSSPPQQPPQPPPRSTSAAPQSSGGKGFFRWWHILLALIFISALHSWFDRGTEQLTQNSPSSSYSKNIVQDKDTWKKDLEKMRPNPATVSGSGKVQPILSPSSPPPQKNDFILIVDQFEKPVKDVRVWFVDNEGKKYPTDGWRGYWNTDDSGRIRLNPSVKGSNDDVPDGAYTVHIEKEYYSSVESKIELITHQFLPNKFVLKKWGKITAVVVNQSNSPVSSVYFWLVDIQGKKYEYSQTSDTGRMETNFLPDGQYTLYLKKDNYDPLEKAIEMSGADIYLDRITFKKWSIISAIILTPSGKPLYAYNSFLIDGQGKRYDTYNTDGSTGRVEMNPVPDGQYTLHLGAYCGNDTCAPWEQAVQVSGSDIFLGKITLSGK